MPDPMDMYHVGYAIHRDGKIKATIDRIEGKFAVLLIIDGKNIKLNVPLALLCPKGPKREIYWISTSESMKLG
jgi:hypothetical protein